MQPEEGCEDFVDFEDYFYKMQLLRLKILDIASRVCNSGVPPNSDEVVDAAKKYHEFIFEYTGEEK